MSDWLSIAVILSLRVAITAPRSTDEAATVAAALCALAPCVCGGERVDGRDGGTP